MGQKRDPAHARSLIPAAAERIASSLPPSLVGHRRGALSRTSEDALRHQPEIAAGELERCALGLPRIAKQPAFQRIEAVGGGEETITAGIAHDDSRRLRRDFDDIGVGHFPGALVPR